GRQRGAVVATASGWLSLVLVALLAVNLLHPGQGASPAQYQTTALVGLGIGHIVGMTIAAAGLAWCIGQLVTRRWLIKQTLLTTATAGAGAVGGAFLGRWCVDFILATSPGPVATIGAALLGGIVAVTVVAGPAVLFDRSIVRALTRRHA